MSQRVLCVMVVVWLLASGTAVHAQAPRPVPQQQQQPEPEPELPRDVKLERDNLLLQARVNELETQLAALKAQFISERISQAAPAVIQRLQAAAPEWDVDPQTLLLKRKQQAAAPGVAPAVAPPSPSQPQPQR